MSRRQARQVGVGAMGLAVLLMSGLLIWGLLHAEDVKVDTIGQPAAAAKIPAAGDEVVKLEPYDLAKIDADADYYKKVKPARVFQMADIADGTQLEEIVIVGEGYRLAVEGDKGVEQLTVRAKAGRPVTFTALDGGHFPANKDISITVKADEKGLASAEFLPGRLGEYRVAAGSPENAGPATFMITVVTAAEKADVESGKHAEAYLAEQKAAAEAAAKRTEQLRAAIQRKRTGK